MSKRAAPTPIMLPQPSIPTYQAPPPYQAPQSPQQTVPQVTAAPQIVTLGNQAESNLPSYLQIPSNYNDPAGRSEYENYYTQTYINPQTAQLRSDLYDGGLNRSTYGGALLGQQLAASELAKFQAGLDYSQNNLNNLLAARSSYFSGGPALAERQDQANVNRGLGVSQIETQQANNQNSYNQNNANAQNSFNQNNAGMQNNYNVVGSQLAQGNQQQRQQLASSQTLGLGSLGLGAAQLLGQGLGFLNRPSAQQAAPATRSPLFSANPISLGSNLGLALGGNSLGFR